MAKMIYVIRTLELNGDSKVVKEFNNFKEAYEYGKSQGWTLKSDKSIFGGYFKNENGDCWAIDIQFKPNQKKEEQCSAK